ncbi:membrane protein [Streptomyces rubellomurinus subsp. indigoferus]|uniref:Membrane protein n=1 Tax=Streptomyces rubellomurinus (strain ATCC 31215) TaxID=359131 RepID=A0A0F2T9Z5_STRR3|nr:M50 family metallopeptidase [Streptomyces rubellomurinus]KJS53950.1 membrane protein [Streptomyces rubellomurinus subsp. indigoferus]KJS58567.1 membrane protein [Streptomyces rubellomurinus]
MSTHPTDHTLGDLWDQVTGTQAAPPGWLVLTTGCAALLAVLARPIWHVARNAVTIAHEGGHGLAALATNRKLAGIRLHSDTSGLTLSYGRPTGPGMVLTAAAGYTAPALLGLGCAALLAADRITLLLWLAIALLLALLVRIRNAFGLFTVLLAGGAFFLVSWFGTAQVQAGFAYLGCWFLLFGAVRPVLELQHQRRIGWARDSDADQLARLTHVPALAWVAVFLLTALASLALGASWLLQPL